MDTTEPEEIETPEVVNLSQVTVESIRAELVRASQTRIQQLNAGEVELQMSAAGGVQARELHARDSALGGVMAEQANVQDSIAGGIRSEDLSFNGVVGLAVANCIEAQEMHAIAVVGRELHADNIRTGILISREIHGNVTATIDGRTALLAGLAGGAVTGLILLAGKLAFGRKK
jgi:hypothetical protein